MPSSGRMCSIQKCVFIFWESPSQGEMLTFNSGTADFPELKYVPLLHVSQSEVKF